MFTFRYSVDFVYDTAPALWILIGFYAEIRRSSLLLAVWGFVSAICIGSLCVVYPLRLPELVIEISERMGDSRNVGYDLAEIMLSCFVWLLYVATAVRFSECVFVYMRLCLCVSVSRFVSEAHQCSACAFASHSSSRPTPTPRKSRSSRWMHHSRRCMKAATPHTSLCPPHSTYEGALYH